MLDKMDNLSLKKSIKLEILNIIKLISNPKKTINSPTKDMIML